MSVEQLDERTRQLLQIEPNELPVLPQPASPAEPAGFSLFLPSHQRRAIALAARFMEIANSAPGEVGLERVLDEAERLSREENSELVRYAVMVFITHHPEGRRLPIPARPNAVLGDAFECGCECARYRSARRWGGGTADYFREYGREHTPQVACSIPWWGT